MYAEDADLYDRVYHFKDYAKEAEVVRGALNGLGVPDGSRVLDAACGTGNHLVQLAPFFRGSGFDRSPHMIALARAKVPDAHLWVADLAAFEVETPVDAAICLFSAIGYLLDRGTLAASARAFAAAIRPGGVLLLEPWLAPDAFRPGRASVQTGPADSDVKIARACVTEREGDISILPFHWLVARPGEPVRHVVDEHRLWLCPHPVLRDVFDEAGFDARLVEPGLLPDRGLLVGVRR